MEIFVDNDSKITKSHQNHQNEGKTDSDRHDHHDQLQKMASISTPKASVISHKSFHHNYGKFSMGEDLYTEKFFDRALHHAHEDPTRNKEKGTNLKTNQ